MSDEEFQLLQHRENDLLEQLSGLAKKTEELRLKWVSTRKLIRIEEQNREVARQIAEEEQEKSPIDIKEEREARMGDMEYDKQVCG